MAALEYQVFTPLFDGNVQLLSSSQCVRCPTITVGSAWVGGAGQGPVLAALQTGVQMRGGARGEGDKCGSIRHNTRFSFVHFAGQTARL